LSKKVGEPVKPRCRASSSVAMTVSETVAFTRVSATAVLTSAAATTPCGQFGTMRTSISMLREILAEPVELAADKLVLVPPSAHHLSAEVTEPVSGECRWSSLPFVLDLPGPLVNEMRAPQAEVHLGVIAEVNHAIGGVNRVAAPAWDASVVMRVNGGNDRFRAHGTSVRARVTLG
jgi:hypothetical protein